MNISLVGPVYPYRGGIAQHTTRLGLAIQAAGHNLQVMSFHKQYPTWLYPGRGDLDPSRSALKIAADRVLEPFAPHTWARTAEKIIHHHSDLVIIQYWTPFWAPTYTFLAARLRTEAIPVAFMVHNVLPHERLPGDQLLAKICLGKGRAFVAHNQREAERLKTVLGNQINVSCLPHPLSDYFQKEERATARARLGYDPDAFLLLFFGLVRPYKGLDCLIQALGKLNQYGPLPQLLVAGEFWQKPAAFRKQINRLGLNEAVRIDNRYIPDEEIPGLFSAADLFVAPYLDGTQSGAVRLAMGFRLPILATDKALAERTLAEKMLAGSDADYPLLKIVPAGDASALAEGIRSWPSGWSPNCLEQPVLPSGWDDLVNELERLALGARKRLI